MSTVSFDHTGLSVGDLHRQCRFYIEAFGFREMHRTEIPDAGIRIALLSGPGGAAVEFTERAGSVPQHFADPNEGAGVQGYFHWALTVDDLEGAVAAAVGHGARVVSRPALARRPGVRFAYVADPEGNLIELLQYTH
ncbi:VOC family protein (plasmid) [Streptomyces sp. NBC_01340]|uniref:VOC family protein n=1 Tax=unclassified Streptomyces TaxID=2593676 RepID=UPI00224DCE8C|nr:MULTISPECIES: VOC family protein [unclassified Streptomyces]MCX4460199.1 VOC family protein [Streptomyces sp. NBC_01719]MCX4500470.1 VOC family protein [Streptomyces sp. NBC_01728]MCX4598176.1 VOC family protein [Streptomyces sp. NBC_01549]WSI45506.1 VOC family protein [Streptomyces sp. NBC_01340]